MIGLRRTSCVAAVAAAGLVLSAAPAAAEARATDDSCPPGAVPEDGFSDVPDGTHEAAVDCVVWWGVARGTSTSTYSPSNPVSRAAMATFIVNTLEAAGWTFEADPPNAFSDDEGDTHEANINKLADVGIVGGTGNGGYSPTAQVSRAQMATFLVNAYEAATQEELADPGSPFSDTAGNTHETNIDKAAGAGFTGGTSPGVYSPSATVRRDAMASFLTRVLDLFVEEGWSSPPGTTTPPPEPPDDGEQPPDEPPADGEGPPAPPGDGDGDGPPAPPDGGEGPPDPPAA